jgi:hypothetical protein
MRVSCIANSAMIPTTGVRIPSRTRSVFCASLKAIESRLRGRRSSQIVGHRESAYLPSWLSSLFAWARIGNGRQVAVWWLSYRSWSVDECSRNTSPSIWRRPADSLGSPQSSRSSFRKRPTRVAPEVVRGHFSIALGPIWRVSAAHEWMYLVSVV